MTDDDDFLSGFFLGLAFGDGPKGGFGLILLILIIAVVLILYYNGYI